MRHVTVPGDGHELSDEQLGATYGKGLELMQQMGFDASRSAGLGSGGEGISVPLHVLDSNSRRAPYERRGLGSAGFAASASGRAGPHFLPAGTEEQAEAGYD